MKNKYFTIIYANGATGWFCGTQEDFDKEFVPKMPKEIPAYYKDNTEQDSLERFYTVKNV